MIFPARFPRRNRSVPRTRGGFRPCLEALEDRAVPALLTVTTAADSGVGSLRAAITAANTAPDLDTIVFAKAVTSITLTTGELAITEDVEIDGPGSKKLTISGNNLSRIFNIQSGDVIISGLTVTKGLADLNAPDFKSVGGAILNQDTLTLIDIVVSSSQAVGDASVTVDLYPTSPLPGLYAFTGGGLGGGLANLDTLTVTGSKFTGNLARGADGSVGVPEPPPVGTSFAGMALGGSIFNFATATVYSSQFTTSRAQGGSNGNGSFAGLGGGGAIYSDADLTIFSSAFSKNRALGGNGGTGFNHVGDGIGGAIVSGSLKALIPAGTGNLVVHQSTFGLNQAKGGNDNSVTTPNADNRPGDGYGGAIFLYQGSARISRTRIHHNQAIGGTAGGDQGGSMGIGGGIFFFNYAGGITATVSNSRIDHNSALGGLGRAGRPGADGLGGGIANTGLGGSFSAPGTITIVNTGVDHNLARGGNGGAGDNGGDGLGGGLFGGTDATLIVNGSSITRNRAIKGLGSGAGIDGEGKGGGVFSDGTYTADAATVVLLNVASTSNNNVFP